MLQRIGFATTSTWLVSPPFLARSSSARPTIPLGLPTWLYTVPPETAPTVASTVPINGATDASVDGAIEINFSEAVTVTGTWFDITCTASGVHTATVTDADPKFTLTPDAAFEISETCTVTIYAASVNDDDTDDTEFDYMAADFSFSFSTLTPPEVCGDPFTPIYDIQGSGATTPLLGQELATEGIVVAISRRMLMSQVTKNGFYIQTATGDGNTDTSDGIFVYSTLVDVHTGSTTCGCAAVRQKT